MKSNEELSDAVRDALAQNDPTLAVERIVEGCGREILAFQRTLARDPDLADEAFAVFCEHLTRGIATWDRTRPLAPWLHAIARNAIRNVLRAERRHVQGRIGDSRVGELAARTRRSLDSGTTGVLGAIDRARRQLDPEDEALLVLRVDRQMSWVDVAVALGLPEPDAAEVARLRKRYQRIKDRIRTLLAESEGR